jgi:ABC-type uncharacterized transport system auxiliary subunit
MIHRCCRWALLALLALLPAGCLFQGEAYRPVRFFDLGEPAATTPANLEIGNFSVSGPYRHKMVSRAANHELHIDEYNQWAQTPSAMLTRYLRQAFAESTPGTRYRVGGDILVFAADPTTGEAVLEVTFTLRDTADRDTIIAHGRRRYAAPLSGPDGTALAAAMTETAAQLADDLARQVPAPSPVVNTEEAKP